MIGEVRYIWHSSGALEVLAPALTRSAILRSLYNLHRSALVNVGLSDSSWIFLSNDIRFLHFCSYFLCNFFDIMKIFFNSSNLSAYNFTNFILSTIILINIVDPVILSTSTPISTSYLFAIQSYTAQTPRGVAIYSVHAQALPLPPSPLHTPNTHHFRYGHQPSIQPNLNHYFIIYSLRDISATNLAICLVARVFVGTPYTGPNLKTYSRQNRRDWFISSRNS
jgi:hypothetical protein